MSTVKFVYRSQNIPDTLPIEGSNKTITSGAVYTAINNIQMDTLFKSGYLPEGIASVIPQHKLTFANGTLTLKEGSYIFIPNGLDENNEFKFTKYYISEDITNTSTYSENMDAYIFVDADTHKIICRTKRSNTINAVTGEPMDSVVQQVWAQLTEPVVAQSTTSNGVIWWDLTENKIKVYNYSTAAWEEKRYGIPLGIVTSQNGHISGIQQDFLMAGVVGNIAWINPGAAIIVPTGLNEEDSTFTNQVLDITDVITKIILTESNDKFTDYAMYLNIDGEIEGPVEEYVFDNRRGLFVDGDGNYHEACRFALASADHLTTATRDPLTVTAFTVRPTMALADNDDIEDVIRLIGSSMGLTIDDLEAEIQAAAHDRALIRSEMGAMINAAKAEVEANMHHVMVHRQLPEGYTESVLNDDIHLDETIYGTKTFAETIIGNITGTAQNVKVGQSSGEIIPLGVTNYSASGDNDIKAANTTVRITNNSVKATKFEGTCTTAYWADLAEMYETDAEYEVGTLLKWGGEKELTLANMGVANAVVSEKPAFLMNAEGKGQPIALAGRVKVRVLGKVKKHDAIVLNEMAPGVGKVQENASEVIVARALEDNDFVGEKLVLCVVRFSL